MFAVARASMRRASKVDSTQAGIVDMLRAFGFTVIVIGRPTDLLVRRNSWPLNTWKLLECKVPNRKVKPGYRPRSDQEAQQTFCKEHGVPYVTTPQEALDAVGRLSP